MKLDLKEKTPEAKRVVRCKLCQVMFQYEKGLPPPCCPNCQRRRNEILAIVRAVVREMPGITALEVHIITDVPVDVIMQFVKNGDIEVMPIASRDDSKVDERIGMLVKKAKERKALLHEKATAEGEGLDEIGPDEKEVFHWIMEDEQGRVEGDAQS
ncbi:MAG: hypothetical protein FWF77_02960 [Defluviitaleaceae bacterium]|nr:hypothetical protein [Defluviitaleaceae bacterium]